LATSPVGKRGLVFTNGNSELLALARVFTAIINCEDEKKVDVLRRGTDPLSTLDTWRIPARDIKPWHRMLCLFALGLIEQLFDHYDSLPESSYYDLTHSMTILLGKLATIANTQGYITLCDHLKHIYVCWLALYLQNPLPESARVIDPIYVTGKLRKFVKMELEKKQSPRARHFFSSMQQNKRCSDTVPEEFILNSLFKHKKALTYQPQPRKPAWYADEWAPSFTTENIFGRVQ